MYFDTGDNGTRLSKHSALPFRTVSASPGRDWKWEKLHVRRKRTTLRCLFRAISKELAWNDIHKQIEKSTFISRTDHTEKLFLPRYQTNTGCNSFLGRSIRLWNAIPQEKMKINHNLKTFNKTLLDLDL